MGKRSKRRFVTGESNPAYAQHLVDQSRAGGYGTHRDRRSRRLRTRGAQRRAAIREEW